MDIHPGWMCDSSVSPKELITQQLIIELTLDQHFFKNTLPTDTTLCYGEDRVGTSLIVVGELRYGVTKRGSDRLTAQLNAILGALDLILLEPGRTLEFRTKIRR